MPAADWSAIEGDLLDERRTAVPAFPLELLTPPWRDWVTAAARSADAPVDYVAQALLNGNAMDIRMPGVPVLQIRQVARSLGMGGVGFYPRMGFVHIDTGAVRYW